jgi:ubiquinone/menaquinone biosynthesis C-methylase UbiE
MPDYSLAVSDAKVRRYRQMAEQPRAAEGELWNLAGIVKGAAIADIGCGPAAVAVLMSQIVGPSGRVIGVDQDEKALAAARQGVKDAAAST